MYTELEGAYEAQGGTSAMFLHNFLCLTPSMSSPLPQSKGFILRNPLPIEPTSLRGRAATSSRDRGVCVTVESNFKHDFSHDVVAVAAVEKPHCSRRPCRRGEAPYYKNAMMVMSSVVLTPLPMEGQAMAVMGVG